MKAKLISSPRDAAAFIKGGEIVGFPTETVYGLGANAFDAKAVKKIFAAKGRPADNPLIVHIHSMRQLSDVACRITPSAKKLMAKFFPGPLSIVLPRNKKIPPVVSASLPTVCVRMPSLQITRKFLRACGVPVAAPSANLSGKPSPTTWHHVEHDLGGRIPAILKGPPCRHGLESTVVDCTKKVPRLLRAGAISAEQIIGVVGELDIPKAAGKAVSPGMKYRHYSPEAKVFIVKDAGEIPSNAKNFAFIGSAPPPKKAIFSARPKTASHYAKILFAFFRKCDEKKILAIYAQAVPKTGMGRAVMERLKKASHGH